MKKDSGKRAGEGVLSALSYSACSIAMVMANKAVVSTYGYPYHMCLLLFQTVATLLLILLWSKLGYLDLPTFDTRIAVRWFPVNLFFLAMLFTSYLSLKLLAVPMVTIFKNLTNVLVLTGDYWLFGQKASKGVIGSLVLMVLGAVLSGMSDAKFTFTGYVWMSLNCCTTAGYLLYMRYVMGSVRLSKPEMAFYNSLLGLPTILVGAFLMGELPAAFTAPQMRFAGFLLAVLVSGCFGFFLQLASLWCIFATSPTTYSMVGAFNKVPVAILGVILFNNPLTAKLAVFISMGICGGILFSYIKSREALERRLAKAAQEELNSSA